jgi:phage shock protein A
MNMRESQQRPDDSDAADIATPDIATPDIATPDIATSDIAAPDIVAGAPTPPIWRKLVDAVRGGANELGEAIVDSQALRILDQEIRDADAELHRSKDALAEMLAHYKVALERLEASGARVEEYEGYALKALKSDEESLAREVAVKIAEIEIERDGGRRRAEGLAARIADLRKVVAQAEAHIKRLKQQVDTVRATATVQRAQATVAHRHAGTDSRLRTALESLERIKRRQAERGARMEAAAGIAHESGDDVLQAKLRVAGIIAEPDGADAVLSRLKKKIES